MSNDMLGAYVGSPQSDRVAARANQVAALGTLARERRRTALNLFADFYAL
jgi:hypothetical protein